MHDLEAMEIATAYHTTDTVERERRVQLLGRKSATRPTMKPRITDAAFLVPSSSATAKGLYTLEDESAETRAVC